ncbi:uncharacterized protein LOC112494979 isoform X2 [Cephus cinctus]|nr:uncharacterized protein LOC112494979 isoform X2 [Cephus cinctus]
MKSLCRVVQRVRVVAAAPPPIPRTVADLVLSEECTQTIRGKMFLQYDSNDDQRFSIFSTKQNLSILQKCDHWHADGTFRTVPNIFLQLYTVHGIYKGLTFPLVYVSSSSKTTQSYRATLEQIKALKRKLNPKTVMCDFELSFIDAVKEVFTNTDVQGCFFHFSQCVWRHVQSTGLQQKYKTSAVFAFEIRKLWRSFR